MRFLSALALLSAVPLLASSQDKTADKGTEVAIGKLKATTPADWKKEKPANLLRSYQFRTPEVKDLPGAEVAVFPESPSKLDKALPRWKSQFILPEGKTFEDVSKTTKWDVKDATVTVFDVNGATWKFKERPQDPASKEVLLDNYRVIWVIVAEEGDATHIRFSGPVTSVEAQYAAFEKWVKALK